LRYLTGMIIGIAGTIGAGKGTVVAYLKQKGFAHYSASGTLKEILIERGLPQTRDYMSPLSNELSAQYPGGVLHLIHEQAKKDGAEHYVLESIHRPSEAEYVRRIGGVIWGVDADLDKRYERTIKRKEGEKDEVTYEQFVAHAKREDEGAGVGNNIREVLKEADEVFQNNGTQDELYNQIELALSKTGT
jgi:dephospho-CoA kinase